MTIMLVGEQTEERKGGNDEQKKTKVKPGALVALEGNRGRYAQEAG